MNWTRLTKRSHPRIPCVFAELNDGSIMYGFLAIYPGDLEKAKRYHYSHYCNLPEVKP